ncbi:MAG: alpha/beta hydrolase [Desulfovibrio sp.]|nr:alpha/beta hydrolase [Desulfovibrio sp.]MBI4961218.1 alpha/beta hydrolase [Desulfovibrio sp.]
MSYRLYQSPLARLALVFVLLLGLAGCAAKPAVQPQVVSGTVQVDGVAVDYTVMGLGEPLLMLTGYAMTRDMWDQEFIDTLASKHRLILMDNRGMGQSRLDPGAEVSIAGMARDAAGLLDAMGISGTGVLGWSMGGMVAQELALARQDLVCSLVLVASASDSAALIPVLDEMNTMSLDQIRETMFPTGWVSAHPETSGRVRRRIAPPDMSVLARQYQAMRTWPGTSSRLMKLRAPVLLLVGKKDWVCPPELSQNMLEFLQGGQATLEVVDHGSHWMMHQFPEELAARVDAFLAGSRCAGTPLGKKRP